MKNNKRRLGVKRFLLATIILCLFMGIPLPVKAKSLNLTEEEQAYIDNTVILTAASVSGGAPHHYFNSKGEIEGIAISVLDEIAALTGLTIEYDLYDSVSEAYASGADIFFGVSKEYIQPGILLSKPYLKSEAILFYNSSLDPSQLGDKRYAAIAGGTIPEGIKEDNVLCFDNREDTFTAVETGLADYGYGNAYSLVFYTLQNGYKNIITIPQGKEDRAYCIGLPKGNKVLQSIINKSINAIDESRMQTIILKVTSQVKRKVAFPMVVETYWKQLSGIIFVVVTVLVVTVSLNIRANKKLKIDMVKIAEREEKIKYLSFHDKLTGLYNRAYFEDKLKYLDDPHNFPISIIIGDINGLKVTNDVFGHFEGDKLLQKTASTLKKSCRSQDIIARYGGDEFAIILPKTTNSAAGKICTRIKMLCKENCIGMVSASISLGWATKKRIKQNIQNVIREAEDMMYRHKLLESSSVRNAIISSLESSLHEKNIESKEHTLHLIKTTAKMGTILGLSSSEMDDLNLLARLHDIGKIAVEERVLRKKGKLTQDEVVEIQKHCEAGYRIAKSSHTLSSISKHILYHHERWDGQGYPHGLKKDEIPLLSRILSIADAYDAMVSDRPYRKALSEEAAIKELKKCSGNQFDPKLVTVFISMIETKLLETNVSGTANPSAHP